MSAREADCLGVFSDFAQCGSTLHGVESAIKEKAHEMA
jgi:hypothetical protein